MVGQSTACAGRDTHGDARLKHVRARRSVRRDAEAVDTNPGRGGILRPSDPVVRRRHVGNLEATRDGLHGTLPGRSAVSTEVKVRAALSVIPVQLGRLRHPMPQTQFVP
jgi:hypothetical protein